MFGDYPRGLSNSQIIAAMRDPVAQGKFNARQDFASRKAAGDRSKAFTEESRRLSRGF
jgi:hypothetical protein